MGYVLSYKYLLTLIEIDFYDNCVVYLGLAIDFHLMRSQVLVFVSQHSV